MQIYLVTAVLVFSFITYVFWHDQAAPKAEIRAWLFIVFAASIWPITLPNMIRKVIGKWQRTRQYGRSSAHPTPHFVYETLQQHPHQSP